ncbi:AIG2-like family protein [Tissierella creatinophila DSM 6911]|uniref:AIG2-like family protein n=1 Tax=Tissierella creatinophila DSM 6911 TaxID=1123403 RepID=A0A1U7M5S4_TISCR|nr:AIG2-like family protein [Tissierella creatinophila DSM 6911]
MGPVRKMKEVIDVKKLYIAYGSNLNLEQMEFRCPGAKVYGKGSLKGYHLLFKGSPNNAYLTIEPKVGSEVPVVVWSIEKADELSLDRYEGYPNFYYKENIPVELERGKVVEAMVYIMTDKIKDRIHLNLPSKNYLQGVRVGYESFGFDQEYIDKALEESKIKGK